MPRRPLIWFKGQHVYPEDALIPVLSPTAQFGLNVFEGIRGYASDSGQVFLFRLEDHLRRLEQSCRLIGIKSPYSKSQIRGSILSILQDNKMHNDLALRVTLFVDGNGSWSSSDPVDMFIAPIYKDRKTITKSSTRTSCISTWRRIDDNILPPRTKAGANYISGRYAHLEAESNHVDLPILLNSSGKVAEGAGACLMMIRDSVLVTPPKTASILESITRDTILTLAIQNGVSVQERDIDRTELYLADEVFLCGSAAEITPLSLIDRFTIGDGMAGPITKVLSSLYFSAADGTTVQYRDWLTPVWKENQK